MNEQGLFSPWIFHRSRESQPVIIQGFVILLLLTSVARAGDAAVLLLGVLAVAEPTHVRLLVQQQTQVLQIAGVPAHGVGDGFVP